MINSDSEPKSFQASGKLKSNENLSSDGLYYEENGFLVFTEKYHLQRGFCCQNNCRHCPYGFMKE